MSESGLLIGAGIGIVVGGAVGAYLDSRHLSTHGDLLPLTASAGAVVGGVLGAGGSAAWKGAGIGLLVGGGLGVIVGVIAGGQGCDGSCAGLGALAFGGLGAGLGVVIGGIVGIANRGAGSAEGSEDPVRLNIAPRGSGVAIGASVAF